MTRPLSMDLRERAMARLAAGESVRAVAGALSVSPSSVVKWSKRLRETGSAAPGRIGGYVPPKIAGPHRDWLVERTRTAPFTLRGLVAELGRARAEGGLQGRCGSSCAARGSALKKTVLASEQDRPDVARKRVRWKTYQGKVDPRRLVFIDETWAKTNMAPLRGWAPKGQRLKAKVPFGHWKTMTFVAALRHDRIDAPWVLDGPHKRRQLQDLCRDGAGPNSWDRATSWSWTISAAIRAAPSAPPSGPRAPGSSSCRPIAQTSTPSEQVFAKLKHLLRKASERTIQGDLAAHRRPAPPLPRRRMRQLPRQRRIRVSLRSSRSRISKLWRSGVREPSNFVPPVPRRQGARLGTPAPPAPRDGSDRTPPLSSGFAPWRR